MNEHHHKMYQYEVTPPARCWEKIASELDASDMAFQYPSRMREFGITPPANAWENITGTLDKENRTVSITRRTRPFLRYAAAAIIIGLIAWGGFRMLSTDKEPATDIANTNRKNIQPAQYPDMTGRDTENNTNNNLPVPDAVKENAVAEARDNAALEASKRTYASIDVPTRSKIRNVSDFFFAPDQSLMGNTRGIDPYVPDTDPADESSEDRYFTLMTPEGNIIRMSKKWGDLVCCVSGEEQDDDCVQQMKKWRQQLASPSHGHATGSFMDILGLLKSLQDDEL